MTIPDSLAAAIQVFRDLGWDQASPEQVMELPLGTPAQRRVAKAGLAKGAWGAFGQIGEHTYGWISWIGVDEAMLGAFAVRVGVTAKRAAAVLPSPHHQFSARLCGRLLAERGARFVSAFAEVPRTNRFHSIAMTLAVTATGAQVPAGAEYLTRWAETAARVLDRSTQHDANDPIHDGELQPRYLDHLRALLRSGAPAPTDVGVLVGEGLARGWVEREEAWDLVLGALEQAQRPIDRKTWAQVLVEVTDPSPEWLLAHAGILISAMSFGDDPVICRFAPMLLGSDDPDLVAQTVVIGVTAKSAKAKLVVIEAALAVPAPDGEAAGMVADSLVPLLTDKNTKLRGRVAELVAAWGLDATPEPEERVAVRGLWQPTPPMAVPPRFDPGPATSEHLTALAASLVQAAAEVLTLDAERFLATANALARRDAGAARTALRGVTRERGVGLVGVPAWVDGGVSPWADQYRQGRPSRITGTFPARGFAVFQRLGSVSVLLSTPSWEDYRIDPVELADRLDAYAADGQLAIEADLQLALPRIDLELVTDEVAARLGASPVPIVLQTGELVSFSVGDVLRAWLAEPITHPGFDPEHPCLPRRIAAVPAIAELPPRLTSDYFWAPIQAFPNWPEARIDRRDGAPATLRNRPNGRVPSTQLLTLVGLDSLEPEAALAAWRNGVLLPGVADPQELGRSSLAAQATAWAELVEEGLLSVIWPLVADIVAQAAAAPRIPPGTAELVALLHRYLPETRIAVERGLAHPSVVELPGVRALAARSGSSRAVSLARALVVA